MAAGQKHVLKKTCKLGWDGGGGGEAAHGPSAASEARAAAPLKEVPAAWKGAEGGAVQR